jgi:hypothetical protein
LLRRLATAAVVLLALAPAAQAATYLRLGFDDDTIKWIVRPDGFVGAQRALGAAFTRITIPWRRGEVVPGPLARTYLLRARLAGNLGQKVVIAVYGRPSQAPTDALSRAQYCSYVRAAVARLPSMSAVVIWNEANSPSFWPQGAGAGAAAYEALLARCYDVLHAYRPTVNVVDSTAAHYDPAGFILGLGAAYRASGRARRIVDTFGHNPYPDSAAEPPWAIHPGLGTVAEGDYQTLLDALAAAFDGTPQPVPSALWPRIWYLEDGFQTSFPPFLSRLYTGRENDPTVLPPVGEGVSQASQLTAAISLAYCQPAVSAFFNFKLVDERRLVGWQSGLMYSNGIWKPSFSAYQQIAAAVANHTIDCTKVDGAPDFLPPP